MILVHLICQSNNMYLALVHNKPDRMVRHLQKSAMFPRYKQMIFLHIFIKFALEFLQNVNDSGQTDMALL